MVTADISKPFSCYTHQKTKTFLQLSQFAHNFSTNAFSGHTSANISQDVHWNFQHNLSPPLQLLSVLDLQMMLQHLKFTPPPLLIATLKLKLHSSF